MSPLLLRTSMQFYLHFPMVLSTYHSQISHQKVHQNHPILIYYIEKSQNFPALCPGPPQTPQLLSSFASRTNIIASLRSAISGFFWDIHSHACTFDVLCLDFGFEVKKNDTCNIRFDFCYKCPFFIIIFFN